MIDVNVYLGRWPFARLPLDEPGDLARGSAELGVAQSWVGSFDALLHKDIAGVNARLTEACDRLGRERFVPFGSVNPTLPDWQEDMRRCHETHRMPGIRLHPDFHGYTLEDERFVELTQQAVDRDLIVQLALKMQDERTAHARLRLSSVDPAPLFGIAEDTPKLRLVLLNSMRDLRGPMLARLTATGRVYVEIAMLEGVGGVENLVEQIGADSILFGTFAPLFAMEAAHLKLKESELRPEDASKIKQTNARNLLRQT